jgi:hypothetical protein
MSLTGLLLLAAIVTSPGPTQLEAADTTPPPAVRPYTAFKCEDGGNLTAQFTNRDAKLIAIVDAGDGPHALPIRPWDGGAPKITWSDGRRTLTWSPGVQIMWMDGASHRMCGSAGHHQH